MKRTLWTLLLFSGLALAATGDFQLGLSAYERGDYAEALVQWLPLAERGDPEAQYRVGRLYYYGRGVAQDYVQAGEWYLKAAEQGHARSRSNIAAMYEEGRGVPANAREAARWYAKAAEQGRTVSQVNLGRMYEEGRGVEQSDSRAVELYAAAAKSGDAEAQYRLGRMYETGKGVPQDSKKAQKWYRKASNNGYDVPTPASRASARAPAAVASVAVADDAEPDDSPTVAEPGPAPEATGDLAEGSAAFERGDYLEAADQWRPLAESGNAEAQFRLGELYRLGQGVPEDPATAGEWHLKAAEQGYAPSMYYVALMYYRGRGGEWEKNYVRAYVWFTLAAEEGIGDANWWRDRLGAKMSDRETAEAKKLLAALDKN